MLPQRSLPKQRRIWKRNKSFYHINTFINSRCRGRKTLPGASKRGIIMNKTVKCRALTVFLLAIAMLLSLVLAACDVGTTPTFLESIPDLTQSEAPSDDTSNYIPPTEEGHTATPIVTNVINITPSEVVIAGTCEQGAVITIKGGKEEVTVNSTNGYFITKTTLINTTITLLDVTADVEGKETSAEYAISAQYSAIAEPRLDGMSVSVGKSSSTYFDKMIADYVGSNLLTQTALRKFKSEVNARVKTINSEQRAHGQEVGLIYVLVPDSTSIYSECLDDSIKRETTITRYQQVSQALSETNATVIDMYDIFMKAKEEGDHRVYRSADSHLTEYGSFLMYTEIMNTIAERFPDAAPRTIDEFDISTTKTVGGDLISYLGVDTSIVSEEIPVFKPKFDMKIGDTESAAFVTTKISDVKVYAGKDDYSIDATKNAGTALSRMYFRTDRADMPSVLIYRDDASANTIPLLAERFNNTMVALSEDFTINYTDAGRHASDGKSIVDYIIVIVSESNLGKVTG